MAEGIALIGMSILFVLLERWLLAHDRNPNGATDGLFALREADGPPAEPSTARSGAAANQSVPKRPPLARDTSLR